MTLPPGPMYLVHAVNGRRRIRCHVITADGETRAAILGLREISRAYAAEGPWSLDRVDPYVPPPPWEPGDAED